MNEVVSLLVRSPTCSINLYLVELFTALANIIAVLLLVSDLRIFLTASNLAENLWTFKLIYSFERIYWPKINIKFSTPDRLEFTDTRWEKCVDKRNNEVNGSKIISSELPSLTRLNLYYACNPLLVLFREFSLRFSKSRSKIRSGREFLGWKTFNEGS